MHSLATAETYRSQFEAAGLQFGVDPNALEALMMVEGSGEQSVSSAGARGIMQTMPNYWSSSELANWTDTQIQVNTGARALRSKMEAAIADKGDAATYVDAAGRYFGCTIEKPCSFGGMDTVTYSELFTSSYAQVNLAHGIVSVPATTVPVQPVNMSTTTDSGTSATPSLWKSPYLLIGGFGLLLVAGIFATQD